LQSYDLSSFFNRAGDENCNADKMSRQSWSDEEGALKVEEKSPTDGERPLVKGNVT